MAQKKINYSEAIDQLNEILSKIEGGELEIDELTTNVKKAAELIKTCKKKLYETEAEVEKILQDLEDDE